MVAVLAMLFLALLATLAIGFYAATNVSVQVSATDERIARAQLAAESGMDFLRYQLATIHLPPDTTTDQLLQNVNAALLEQLDGTGNFHGTAVGYDASGQALLIPADPSDSVPLDAQGRSRFRASVRVAPDDRLSVTITGLWVAGDSASSSRLDRHVQMEFASVPITSALFDYGIASRSPIVMTGNTTVRGSNDEQDGKVLSTTDRNPTISATGNNQISGDVFLTNPDGTVVLSGSSRIAGSSIPSIYNQHIHTGVEPPDFPVIDTDPFAAFAVNEITSSSISGNKTLSNIRIKAGANTHFSGNITLNGVVYIETPNQISFTGNLTVTGVIVVQNNPTGSVDTNWIDFGGNVTFSGPENLPASYGQLRTMTGSAILAPTFDLKMRGNFGTVGGSIVAGKTEFSGNAGGTIRGSMINLEDTVVSLTGNTDLAFDPTGVNRHPAGMKFGNTFRPLPSTYTEPMTP